MKSDDFLVGRNGGLGGWWVNPSTSDFAPSTASKASHTIPGSAIPAPIQQYAKSLVRDRRTFFSRQPLYVSETIVTRVNDYSNVGSTSRREHRLGRPSRPLLAPSLPHNKEDTFQRLHECALGLRANWHSCWDFRLACRSSLRSQFFGYNSAGALDNIFHRRTVAKCRARIWRTHEANFKQCC
jgi:hypothetical protein